MKTHRLKPRHDCVVKTSISLPPRLHAVAVDRMRAEGFPTLSGLFQQLLRERQLKAAQPSTP